MKNRNPNEVSEFPEALFDFARTQGMKLIHVSLINKPPKGQLIKDGLKSVEGGGFWAAVHEVPKVGECVLTENKKLCDVVLVAHRIRKVPAPAAGHVLIPTVFAVLDENDVAGI